MNDFLDDLRIKLHNIDKHDLSFARGVIKGTRLMSGRLIFIGNGGSAAIASHLATDFTKNGRIEAISFNDASALTCVANDYGYDRVFSKQIEWHAKRNDVLIAISSSGESENILNAVDAAKKMLMTTVTLSGFDEDNALRKMGFVNFYIPSHDYGIVEVCHLAIMHSMVGKA